MRSFLVFSFLLFSLISNAQSSKNKTDRPKLVVGIVIDQMRWDFLYRYYERYGNDGFKRLMNKGFNAENCQISYLPSYTACGHACVYTGSVPSLHGITGNSFYDRNIGKVINNVDDSTVQSVGTTTKAGRMSPKNLLTTTLGDEIKLASNFRSKVIGISAKDRGAILPGGHAADAAYWIDGNNGNFITSTHYMNTLPQWVVNFNNRKIPDSFYTIGWNTLYPINTYTQSTKDENDYESTPFGAAKKGFPYNLSENVGKNNLSIANIPQGINYTFMMAEEAIKNEQLGKRGETDMLAISISNTDYIGHSFGPNSIETEDSYLRLDAEIAKFLNYLDKTIGKNDYTVFLTADHGVAHVPQFDSLHNLPGGTFFDDKAKDNINELINTKYGIDKAVQTIINYQIFLNKKLTESDKAEDVKKYIIEQLNKMPEVAYSFELAKANDYPMPARVREMVNNGYYYNRSGDIQIILKSGYFDGWGKGTSHGMLYNYDTHIPMLFYGWGIKQGKTNRETYMTDLAPTISALLKIQMPSGCIGKVVTEALK